MNNIHLPKLSEYDPVMSAEGALDPLGLYAIADSLAVRLVPGIRERMSHPRFLTAIAAGNIITQHYEEDELAADNQSQPYLVYEWYAVEGLVRSRGDDPHLNRLPGILKVKDCIREKLPISSARYLKTASVFGFHGVYRLLADNLDIVRNGYLGENGYQLLETWEKEQSLYGYTSGNTGPGYKRRGQIQSAVQEAMAKGAVCRSGYWDGWSFFGNHLFPNEIPPKETEILRRFFISDKHSSRAQVIRFLVSKEGCRILNENKSEREFHAALRQNVDEATGHLLDAIEAYENFSRLLQDAFDDCLVAMTEKRGRISPAELSKREGCKKANKQLPNMYQKINELLEPMELSSRFNDSFWPFENRIRAEDWVVTLLDYHVNVQRQKPPSGKNPWFERFDDGSVVVRAGYRRNEGGRHDGSYVNAYRTEPLLSFFSDLKMVSN